MEDKKCPACGSPLILNATTSEWWHVWIPTKECPDPNDPPQVDESVVAAKIKQLKELEKGK